VEEDDGVIKGGLDGKAGMLRGELEEGCGRGMWKRDVEEGCGRGMWKRDVEEGG